MTIPTTTTRDTLREAIRNAVLKALDEATQEQTGRERSGWKDCDLPDLFGALDAHATTLAIRWSVPRETED